jgi:2-phospho-L-lactate guanylyltransferase (CobY/MobA/RfbA family)
MQSSVELAGADDPEDLFGVAAVGHREDADRIGAKQEVRVDGGHPLRLVAERGRGQPAP